ncbi:hypothetical protein SARC_12036 [Sphaeroforma arctica JP610]|uniref:Uncharacterized protein n=1 Tax=Sphaeroforma arctica JP610 TaxID=667725 RepID=A0A0L0FHB1_9EUKA|nr:hypothetical protein SARC_12036 [Sphaeroforma arctica JP610]KNC75438.1 hypothetical protein SARC_12036 [Sphaeroforma arctica JP610]|eukprot:XP_014149340.1 hypothetical protein SARC_12036 [Sphaeroforma arctica JP610]
MVGTVDPTMRVSERTSNGTISGGVNAVAPGGELFFGGVVSPALQSIIGLATATTCQYRVVWTATESTVQEKRNFYEFNSGTVHAIATATAVAVMAAQAIERGENATILAVEDELKKYTIQPTWCGTDCDAYGSGILTMQVQE